MRNWLMLMMLPAAAGCGSLYDRLPANAAPVAEKRAVPADARTLGWHAQTGTLKTFWGDQAITLRCRGAFPATWREPGDELWTVQAANQDGTAVPFAGVLSRGTGKEGQKVTEVRPPLDFAKLRDGIYLLIEPQVKLADGKIAEVRLTALLTEIRKHGFMPWRVKVPLVPDEESALTPKPAEPPPGEFPSTTGTPVPL
jgi:hypothetical protein